MQKFIITAWKNNAHNMAMIRESVAYDLETASGIQDMFKTFGYNAIITEEEISDVEQAFVTKFEGFAG